MSNRKKNCRRTDEERAIHDRATRLRKMTDAQLCAFVDSTYGKGMEEGAKLADQQGAAVQPCEEGARLFVKFLEGRTGSGNRIGKGTVRFNPDLCDIEAQNYEIILSNFRNKTQDGEKNDPLTLNDLKEMNGEPVWREKPGHDGRWVLVDCFWSREGVVYLRSIGGSSELAETAFKEGVKVYRHKPEVYI